MDKQQQQQQQQQRQPPTWYQMALAFSTPAPQPEPERCPACGSAEVYRWRRVRTCAVCFHMWEVKYVPKRNELGGEVR